jgi:hypothetical protein
VTAKRARCVPQLQLYSRFCAGMLRYFLRGNKKPVQPQVFIFVAMHFRLLEIKAT